MTTTKAPTGLGSASKATVESRIGESRVVSRYAAILGLSFLPADSLLQRNLAEHDNHRRRRGGNANFQL